jgi:FkbM family methyltransferase
MTKAQKIVYKLHRLKTKLFLLFNSKDFETFAQDQEDLVLDILLGNKVKGFYVDIGANDPNVISVTKKFYNRGWRGINVEPSLRMHKKLIEYRPEDLNLNYAVGNGQEVDFFEPKQEWATVGSTCNPNLPSKDNWDMADTTVQKIKTVPLSEIFLQAPPVVDFMKIDVEAYEWEVLKSHDWKNKPLVLCIEGKGFDDYLSEFGYRKAFFDGGNSYYKLYE